MSKPEAAATKNDWTTGEANSAAKPVAENNLGIATTLAATIATQLLGRLASHLVVAVTVALAIGVASAVLGAGCYVAVNKSDDSPNPSPDANDLCPARDPLCMPTGSEPAGAPVGPAGGPYGATGGADGALPAAGTGGIVGPPGSTGSGGTAGRSPSPGAPLPPAPAASATCPSVTVSRFNELMIVNPVVVNDSRADNEASDRPWSFRQRLEALVPGAPDTAGTLADAWLGQWSSLTDVPVSTVPGAARVPITPRAAADELLRCPWLLLSRDNGCDPECGGCRSRRMDLAQAPFHLLAIANRVDQATTGGATTGAVACGANGGELRFVYGAADPVTRRVLPFTVIFEYTITLLPGETLRDWAAAWHALGTATLGSSAFNARLDAVVAQGLARATLRRVLTNEVAFGTGDGLPWEMRQFVPALTDAGTTRLLEVAMSGTPRLTLAQAPELGQWIDENAMSVLAGDNPLPATLVASSAPIPAADFAWRTTARDAATATAFNRNTCNGCHGGRSDPTDVPFQHVAPPGDMYYGSFNATPSSSARLSRFLHDPGHDDELGRRERGLAAILCAQCAGASY